MLCRREQNAQRETRAAVGVRQGRHHRPHAGRPDCRHEQPGGTVGGFFEFEAETDEEAGRLASQIPAVSQGGAVEIRPSKVYW